jgi:hypothetical protein
LIRVLQSQEI